MGKWIKQSDLDNGKRTDGLISEEREKLRRLRRENRSSRLPWLAPPCYSSLRCLPSSDPTHPEPVVRKTARRTITFTDQTSHYQLLTPSTRGAFEVLSLELAAGAASGDVALGHDSEELLLVLRGDVEAEVAGQTYTLSAGDSPYLQRNVPHRAINRGTTVAEILMVISPASF